MPDPFSTLPAPLPLMVFEAIEDLSTLNYLLQSSPTANAIFERYCWQITEAVLSNFVPQLRQLLRTILLVRSECLSIRNGLGSLVALDSFLVARVLNSNACAKPISNRTVSLSAVRSLARSASHVQQASTSFFEEFLDRANSIKPSYIVDKFYDFKDYRGKLPEGRPYKPLKCGHPSWIEEQRVHRALWRLQLYFDLVAITRPNLGITSRVWDLLENEGPHGVWGDLKPFWQLDEMDCVYEFLCELSNATTPSGRPSHLSKLPATEPKRVTVPKPIPYHDYVSTEWGQTSKDLNSRSPAVNLFQSIRLSLNPFLHNPSFEPFPRLDFKPFRRLDFDIWDREKMARLGMGKVPRFIKQPEFRWGGPFSSGSSVFEFYFRWNSLVVEDCKNDA